MILVDTSIWIDHLRRGDPRLQELLERRQVLSHPFIIGELAMGGLRRRETTLRDLQNLPQIKVVHEDEVMRFISQTKLFDLGIGYIDAHLLAATQLTPGVLLWTRDKRLLEVAANLGLAAL